MVPHIRTPLYMKRLASLFCFIELAVGELRGWRVVRCVVLGSWRGWRAGEVASLIARRFGARFAVYWRLFRWLVAKLVEWAVDWRAVHQDCRMMVAMCVEWAAAWTLGGIGKARMSQNDGQWAVRLCAGAHWMDILDRCVGRSFAVRVVAAHSMCFAAKSCPMWVLRGGRAAHSMNFGAARGIWWSAARHRADASMLARLPNSEMNTRFLQCNRYSYCGCRR